MLPFVDTKGSGIETMKRFGKLLVIMVEEEWIIEGWVFQHREGDCMKTSDMNEGFKQISRRVKLEEVGLIPEVVKVG